MRKRYLVLLVVVLTVVITYYAGPETPEPTYATELPELPDDLATLTRELAAREAGQPVRAGNQAHIRYFADPPARTEYAVVYLHGFGASWRDAFPANVALADSLEANLYLGRWGNHGQHPPHQLENFSPELAWEDAREALAYGKRLGDKVIILSTSTGGTLALKLAAEFPEDVHALVNFSPNIKDDVPGSWMLNSPWGQELAQIVTLGDGQKQVTHAQPNAAQYYDTLVPAEALVNLQVLVSTTMHEETFANIRCPVLTLYYYEDFFNQDERVEINVYPDVHAALGTPDDRHELKALATPKSHFLGCDFKSRDTEKPVEEALAFLRKVGV